MAQSNPISFTRMMAQQHEPQRLLQDHPIFGDIYRGDLEAVRQRVREDPAVLEERAAIS